MRRTELNGWSRASPGSPITALWHSWSMEGKAIANSVVARMAGSVIQAGSVGQIVLPAARMPVPRQLPPAVPDFVGREGEIAELDRVLAGPSALAVVEGMGGIGKTALVVAWAHRVRERFPDGTLFVDLRGFGAAAPLAPLAVLSGFAQALGLTAEQLPDDLDALGGLYRSMLTDRRVLVVLDNAVSPEHVRPLLPGCAGCAVVVTSRASLAGLVAVNGAAAVPVGTLPAGASATLVRAIVGTARADAEARAVAELIGLCGGLPLALRVAASRVAFNRHTGVAGIVEEIMDERDRLEGLGVPGDERSRVRAVFASSYTRLPGEHARVFRLLGLHPGVEFGAPAVAALIGASERETCRRLAALCDLHLVETVGVKRYRLHDLLHVYAAERVAVEESDERRQQALSSMLTWYAAAADAADLALYPGTARPEVRLDVAGVPAFDRRTASEWLTLEAATVVACARIAGRTLVWPAAMLLACSCRFLMWCHRGMWPLRLEAESSALNAARAVRDREAETFLLVRRADTLQELRRWAEADADLGRGLDLARVGGNIRREHEALCGLGYNRLASGNHREALELYLEALPLTRSAGDVRAEAVVECNLGAIQAEIGNHREAVLHTERELSLRRKAGDAVGEAYARYGLAMAWQRLGVHETAIQFGEQAVRQYGELNVASRLRALALEVLATSYASTGRLRAAVQALTAARTVMTELGDPRAAEVGARLTALRRQLRQAGQSTRGAGKRTE